MRAILVGGPGEAAGRIIELGDTSTWRITIPDGHHWDYARNFAVFEYVKPPIPEDEPHIIRSTN